MYKEKSVCVMIPAHNEATQIGKVIETLPDFVDHVVIVDDASADDTVAVVRQYQQAQDRITLLTHESNQGVGGALSTGCKWARDHDFDVAVRMDGDGQMNPKNLPDLLDPVVENRAEEALRIIDWDKMYRYYGQPNDLLIRLNVYDFRVADVPVEPVYNVGEKSGIRIGRVVFTISWLLIKMFFWRMKEKYIIRDFHPLVFFYILGGFFTISAILLFARVFYYWFAIGHIMSVNALAAFFSFMSASQFTLFAMWFDMEANKELKVKHAGRTDLCDNMPLVTGSPLSKKDEIRE